MQPFGQFIATWVAVAVTASFQAGMKDAGSCTSLGCFRAVDKDWRWIVGIGGLPALLAMIIRLQIPESPRYTMDVLLDWKKALKDTKGYFVVEGDPIPLQDGKGQSSGHITPGNSVAGGQTTDSPPGQYERTDSSMNGRIVEQPGSPTAVAHRQRETFGLATIHTSTSNKTHAAPFIFRKWLAGFRNISLKMAIGSI